MGKRSRAAGLGVSLLAALACEGAGEHQRPTVSVSSGGAGELGGSAGVAVGGTGDVGGEAGRADYPDPSGEPCNAWAALCDVPYDQVSFPVTHAAMASSASFWDHPAQRTAVRTQLDDSIRGLMLEVHRNGDELALCFHDCTEGHVPLLPELRHVREFLDDNPREVVTLLVDNRVPAADFAGEVVAAGLEPYLFTGDAGAGWPTLGELVSRATRLVVFLEQASEAAPGYRDLHESVASTGGGFTRARDLDCAVAAGNRAAPMLLVQQVLVTSEGAPGAGGEGGAAALGRPSEELAETVNRDPFLSERLTSCADTFGKNPTFVAVDFYDTSDVIAATQRLGGLIE